MTEILEKAQKRQNELSEKISSSKEILAQRPLFHFATPGGWCNDPNGFSEFNGKVHLFYQYHPYSTQWGPMHWGHVTTKDMLTWSLESVALAPDTNADKNGCFSGTAISTEDGRQIIAYTGVSKDGDKEIQNQCIAFGDGKTYEKFSQNPVLTAKDIPFEYQKDHFRDPKIWQKDGKFYMACVLKQLDNCGAMVIFESKDAKKWTYKGILDSSRNDFSGMWECPDVLNLDGKDMLIFSPQEMKKDYNAGFHDGNNSVYSTGLLDYKKFKFFSDIRAENKCFAAQIDYGIDFYAPQTTKLSDGRTILIAWMQAWESYITPENYLWSGMMTIPRELSFKNNRLYQNPVRELENLRADEENSEIPPEKEKTILNQQERHFELEFQVSEKTSGTIKIILGNTEDEYVLLKIDLYEQSIYFDRSKSQIPGKISERKAKLPPKEKETKIRIIGDTCSLEVFVDDGKMAFTNTFFLSKTNTDLRIRNETSQKIRCKTWKLQKQEAR